MRNPSVVNHNQILAEVAAELGYSKNSVKKAYKLFTQKLVEHLENGTDVDITSIVSFQIAEQAEREYVNIKTKERYVVPKTQVVKPRVRSKIKALKKVIK